MSAVVAARALELAAWRHGLETERAAEAGRRSPRARQLVAEARAAVTAWEQAHRARVLAELAEAYETHVARQGVRS